jgi:hypothetical protein
MSMKNGAVHKNIIFVNQTLFAILRLFATFA